jgi:hypothetical protein
MTTQKSTVDDAFEQLLSKGLANSRHQVLAVAPPMYRLNFGERNIEDPKRSAGLKAV